MAKVFEGKILEFLPYGKDFSKGNLIVGVCRDVMDDENCNKLSHAWLRIDSFKESGKHSTIEIPARRAWVVAHSKITPEKLKEYERLKKYIQEDVL